MKISKNCADCFAGLSAKTRIEIVNLLQKENKMSVLEIVGQFDLAQPTITHHLQYLKTAGLLSSTKKGRQVFYYLNPKCKDGRCELLE